MNSPKSLLPSSPQRRRFLQTSVLGGMTAALLPALAGARELATSTRAPDVKPFELDEMTIADLQAGMSSGKFTARSITEKYLTRIDAIDKQGPAINSVLELNSDALAMADAADKERRDKGARGPLHGIPVLIKDNIDTADRLEQLFSARPISASGRTFAPAIPQVDGADVAAKQKILTPSIAIPVALAQARAQPQARTFALQRWARKQMALWFALHLRTDL